MSIEAFQTMLADPKQAGVFFLLESDLDTIVALVEDSPLQLCQINLHNCTDKEETLARLATALQTPSAQGCNWDALADQLRDLSWRPAPGYVLLFSGAHDLRSAQPEAFETLLDILDEAGVDWQLRNQPFWAFLLLPDAAETTA